MKYIIKKKEILQAKRINEMKKGSQIKDVRQNSQNIYMEKKNVEMTADKLHPKTLLPATSKNTPNALSKKK